MADRVTLPLRLDPDLHARIAAAARRHERSINNLIALVMREWVDQDERQAGGRS